MSTVIVEHRDRPPLSAKALKATLVLTPAELLQVPVPDGQPRCAIRVAVAGRTVTADLNAKSVRLAIANIREAGVDNVAVVLQGKLGQNNELLEAGLTIQLKTKPIPPSE